MTDEQQKLVSTFNAARKRLDGASGKSASGVEAAYGEAYQALVKAGIAPQIKAKYRR
jgi:hypothetical protein